MVVVDEYLALLALVDRPLAGQPEPPFVISYSRAYRLTRALLDPGPGRLAVRGRFTRLVDGLEPSDQVALHGRLAEPDPAILSVVDPRPTIRTAAAIQNTYALSLLQAETLAAAVVHDWSIVFADADGAPDPFRRAVTELGIDFRILTAPE